MSIVRTKRTADFTVIPNAIINDDALDGDALGLLVYLLSKPADWWIKIDAISTVGRFGGKNKVNRTLATLRGLGYASMTRSSTGHTEWVIYDVRKEVEDPVNTPHPQNEDEAKKPHPQKPDMAFPDMAFGDVLLNKDLDKELTETKNGFSLPGWLPIDAWAGFKEMRRKKKKEMTPHAEELMLKKLDAFRMAGHDVRAILEKSILNSWQDCFPLKETAQDSAIATPRSQGPSTHRGQANFRTFEQMRAENTNAAIDAFLYGDDNVGVTIDA